MFRIHPHIELNTKAKITQNCEEYVDIILAMWVCVSVGKVKVRIMHEAGYV